MPIISQYVRGVCAQRKAILRDLARASTPLQMLLTVTLAILAPTAKLTLFTIYTGAALSQPAIAEVNPKPAISSETAKAKI